MALSLKELKDRFPMFNAIFVHIGEDRLLEIVNQLGITTVEKRSFFIREDYKDAILEHLQDPRLVRPYLIPKDLEKTDQLELFFGTREKWQERYPGEDFDELAFEKLVQEVEVIEPPKKILKENKQKKNTQGWPEFASLKKWQTLSEQQKLDTGKALEKALGKEYSLRRFRNGTECRSKKICSESSQ
jgi:hypothetical protein